MFFWGRAGLQLWERRTGLSLKSPGLQSWLLGNADWAALIFTVAENTKGGQGFAIARRGFQRVLIILENLAVGKGSPGSFCSMLRSWKPVNCCDSL